MNRFAFANPKSFKEAGDLLTDARFKLPVLKAGGLDVLDHMKEGLYEPDALINIRRLKVDGSAAIAAEGGGVRIGATTTLAEIAASPIIREKSPVLGQAVHSAATPQVRNIATAAGNLLQRPRCWYYRNEQFHCLKKGGDRCYAVEGENKYHAIFGGGPCHIVHPSNLAPALMVCDGIVHLTGGKRASAGQGCDQRAQPGAG
jgi:xanthine dehydrogenase YagS FAD-binding subunit